jgi:hypothetical protein
MQGQKMLFPLTRRLLLIIIVPYIEKALTEKSKPLKAFKRAAHGEKRQAKGLKITPERRTQRLCGQ